MSEPDCSAGMKNDPASIVECCRITHSAEEMLGTVSFAVALIEPISSYSPEKILGTYGSESEELTQHEMDPIIMLSLPDTESPPAANAESSYHDASETLPPISSDAGGQYVACNASTAADPDKAVDLGREDSSVPMDYEMAQEVVDDVNSESETDNYRVVIRGAASDDPNRSEFRCNSKSGTETENYRFVRRRYASDDPDITELRCNSSEPRVVRVPDKVQHVQEGTIEEDDPQPPKKVKIDSLNVLKEIAQHQKNCSWMPKRYGGFTFPRPRWWPENYEDVV